MSYERSFQFMEIDELLIKKKFDEYRLQTLNEGVLVPIQKWGIGGLDEAWYAFSHAVIPFASARKRSYLEDQIALAEQELTHREKSGLSTKHERMLAVEPNPATFFTFREEREALRKERLKRMEAAGEKLHTGEYLALLTQLVSETAASITSSFGRAGEWTSRNFLTLACLGTFSCSGYTGYNYLCYEEVYQGVAKEYRESHQVGPYSLLLKRDIPDELILVIVNLTYTPEVQVKVKDSTITIPEKRSSPGMAMAEIHEMDNAMKQNLSDTILYSLDGFSDQERSRLAQYRDDAHENFSAAYISLIGAMNTSISYPQQIAFASTANDYVQNAVSILESHMDKKIVDKENDAHAQMSFWKWLTIGLGVVGGILGYSAVKTAEHRNRYDRYYGNY